jgi:folate-binding protein YgfZ
MVKQALLEDRGVVEIAGPDAVTFLHNLVTNDIASLGAGQARFAALLAPQGKILFDFLVFARDRDEGRALLLDCPRALAGGLVRRLGMYRLRARATIADRSEEIASLALWDTIERPEVAALALARDPRSPALGWRALVPRTVTVAQTGAREAYDALRIGAGVPEGGVDFVYGDAFPHEANMDRLAGVDFAKGCFIGQEVVARMKHRGAARKRVTPYHTRGPAPAPGTRVMAGELEIGMTGSRVGDRGLALIRLDRLADATAAGVTPRAGGAALAFEPAGD